MHILSLSLLSLFLFLSLSLSIYLLQLSLSVSLSIYLSVSFSLSIYFSLNFFCLCFHSFIFLNNVIAKVVALNRSILHCLHQLCIFFSVLLHIWLSLFQIWKSNNCMKAIEMEHQQLLCIWSHQYHLSIYPYIHLPCRGVASFTGGCQHLIHKHINIGLFYE